MIGRVGLACVAVVVLGLTVVVLVLACRGRYEYRSVGPSGVIMYKIDRFRGLEWISVAGRAWTPIDVQVGVAKGDDVAPWDEP